jgi:hypothetical protein
MSTLQGKKGVSDRMGAGEERERSWRIIGIVEKWTEAEFLDEIQKKFWRVFLFAIHSHLYSSALSFLFLQTHATSYSFHSSVSVHCKEERRKTW